MRYRGPNGTVHTMTPALGRVIDKELERRERLREEPRVEYRDCPKCGCCVEYRYGMTRCETCGVRTYYEPTP